MVGAALAAGVELFETVGEHWVRAIDGRGIHQHVELGTGDHAGLVLIENGPATEVCSQIKDADVVVVIRPEGVMAGHLKTGAAMAVEQWVIDHGEVTRDIAGTAPVAEGVAA